MLACMDERAYSCCCCCCCCFKAYWKYGAPAGKPYGKPKGNGCCFSFPASWGLYPPTAGP